MGYLLAICRYKTSSLPDFPKVMNYPKGIFLICIDVDIVTFKKFGKVCIEGFFLTHVIHDV